MKREKNRIRKWISAAGWTLCLSAFLFVGTCLVQAKEQADSTPPVISLSADTPDAGYAKENVLLYAGSMSYTLLVYDPICYDQNGKKKYSGLASVDWEISGAPKELITASGNHSTYAGEQSDHLTIPVDITGTGECPDLIVTVTAADRSGNTAALWRYVRLPA